MRCESMLRTTRFQMFLLLSREKFENGSFGKMAEAQKNIVVKNHFENLEDLLLVHNVARLG